MASVAIAHYNYLFDELADSRTNGWLLLEPWVLVTALIVYCFLIFSLLPNYMKQRKPYKLKRIIQLYNIFQIFACFYILCGAYTLDTNQYWYGCYPTDYSHTSMALRTLVLFWFSLVLKYIDLIETMFFVLRKKYEQVSTLHVYHHVATLIIAWVGTKYVGGGVAALPGILNAFAHTIMYVYYFLAATGPNVQAELARLKPFITIVQIIQLCIIVATGFVGLVPGCEVSILVAWLYIPNIIMFLILFVNFYLKTYVNKSEKKLRNL